MSCRLPMSSVEAPGSIVSNRLQPNMLNKEAQSVTLYTWCEKDYTMTCAYTNYGYIAALLSNNRPALMARPFGLKHKATKLSWYGKKRWSNRL